MTQYSIPRKCDDGAIGSLQVSFVNYISISSPPKQDLKASAAVPGAASSTIINVSSVTGQQSFGGCALYCASKAAVDMLTRCASVDLASSNIRVNAVNPGVVATPLQLRGGMTEENYTKFIDRRYLVYNTFSSIIYVSQIMFFTTHN
jgi:NAD(P)-dependent dehydrogenase (short-subunit alcohol dehydrogenase family)